MESHGAVQDLGFYETRWILRFLFKHYLMNEIKFCLNELEWCLKNISQNISFKAVFAFLNGNLKEFRRFHIFLGSK
jgi:hypothetical protein